MDDEEKIVNEEIPADVPMAMSGFFTFWISSAYRSFEFRNKVTSARCTFTLELCDTKSVIILTRYRIFSIITHWLKSQNKEVDNEDKKDDLPPAESPTNEPPEPAWQAPTADDLR